MCSCCFSFFLSSLSFCLFCFFFFFLFFFFVYLSSVFFFFFFFFFSSRRRHTRFDCDWSSDVCSSDLHGVAHDAACWIANSLARHAIVRALRAPSAPRSYLPTANQYRLPE